MGKVEAPVTAGGRKEVRGWWEIRGLGSGQTGGRYRLTRVLCTGGINRMLGRHSVSEGHSSFS